MKIALQTITLFIGFTLYTFSAFSQSRNKADYQKAFDQIDSLAKNQATKKALPLITDLCAKARLEGNTQMLIRATMYQMIFSSYMENSIVAALSLLQDDVATVKQPEKSILQSILAEGYWIYYRSNAYRIRQRTDVAADTEEDIQLWSSKKLIRESLKNYLASLSEMTLLQNVKTARIKDIIIGDTATRYLRPTLYDLLADRALIVFMNTQSDLEDAGVSADSLSLAPNAMKVFQNLLSYHNAHKNTAAWADVELKRIKFIYQRNRETGKGKKYLETLSNLLKQCEGTDIYADVLFEMALLYKNQEVLPEIPSQNLSKALALAEEAIRARPQSAGAKNAGNMIKEIGKKYLNITIGQFAAPQKPIQVLYGYKNLDSIYLKLYQLPFDPLNPAGEFGREDLYATFLKKHKVYRYWSVALPKKTDHQQHNIADRIEGLPTGSYLLVAQHGDALDSLSEDPVNNYSKFTVTGMDVSNRYIEPQVQYTVTDNQTGDPLRDVKILVSRREWTGKTYTYRSNETKTDENGAAALTGFKDTYATTVTHGTDTVMLGQPNLYPQRQSSNQVVLMFTDRPIYRPGQIVYYKGLYFTDYNGKRTILTNEKIEVKLGDVNGNSMESTSLTTNEYGTFQGSFKIPSGKLNGTMVLETNYGSKEVQVEEYKRPTFEVLFDKITRRYKLNDSITVKGRASTYSGYQVGGANVKYTVTRNTTFNYDYYTTRPYDNEITQIATGTTTTKPDGSFDVTFFANEDGLNGKYYTYTISTDVTDIGGETKTSEKTVNVGRSDLTLNVGLPYQLFLNTQNDSIPVSVMNLNNQRIKGKVTAHWFPLQFPGRLATRSHFEQKPEEYSLSREEFIRIFPGEEYAGETDPATWKANARALTQETTAALGTGTFILNEKDLKPGYYRVKFTAENEAKDTVSEERIVRIYDHNPTSIQTPGEWLVSEQTSIRPGRPATFRLAGLKSGTKAYYEVYYREEVLKKVWVEVSAQQTIISIPSGPDFEESFAVQFSMVQNGTTYKSLQTIEITDPRKQLDVKFLSFRNKLEPGEKESWKLKISNKAGEKQMAELVATLYDASLETLRPMDWGNIQHYAYNYYKYTWTSGLNETRNGTPLWYNYKNYYIPGGTRNYEQLNFYSFNFSNAPSYILGNFLRNIETTKAIRFEEDRAKRLSELKASGLFYGTVKNNNGELLPGTLVKLGKISTIADAFGIYQINAKAGEILTFSLFGYTNLTIRVKPGQTRLNATLQGNSKNLSEVVIRGYQKRSREQTTGSSFIVTGKEVQDVPVANVEQLLQGRVAGLNISNNNLAEQKIVNTKTKDGVAVRSNFNETAFFYPQLHTNENGEINIEFTIPQSLTRYRMRGFAHTKDFKTTSFSRELITQKQLAISASTPRFFREGDTILFLARLNNLSGKKLKGKAVMEFSDALTGNALQLFAPATKSTQNFQLANAGNAAVKWQLIIPSGVSAITYKLTAESGRYNDGEQMIIPVLPNGMLVTESMPLNVRGNSSKTFVMDKLLQSGKSSTLKNQSYTMEFSSNPAWYAVQALPYLMEYPYECAEQTFSRFYANSFATGIINSSPKIKEVFNQWQQSGGEDLASSLEKNQELKSILLEETPWVKAANNDKERKKRLAVLFDLDRMSGELKANFEKLEKMQFPNGAFPWFSGMQENRYITQYIVQGMSQLKYLKLIDENAYPNINIVLNKAIIYLDGMLEADYKTDLQYKTASYLPLHYLYARSYSKQTNNNPKFKKAYEHYTDQISKNWQSMGIYQQGLAALVLHRSGNHAEAMKIVAALKDHAQQNEEMGMYWAENINGWWWYQSSVETQSLLIEVFDEVASDAAAVEEMKIWLLKNKQTTEWQTTKATTAACYALLMRGNNLLDGNTEPDIKIGDKTIAQLGLDEPVKTVGTGYRNVSIPGAKVKPEMGKIEIRNNNKSISWGGVYWQYFEQLDKISPAETGVKIKKQLFINSNNGKGDLLVPLSAASTLKTGDLLKVRIEIRADRDMEYIHLKDMRSSGFEPVNVISQFKYQDGLGYYESTKDASTNFFIDFMRKGVYVFEYPLRVSHSGNFSNGITTLQCMYAPEFSTHSEGIRVKVKP